MSTEYSYSREKLWQSINELVGDGSVQDRLAEAGVYLIRLRGENMPGNMQAQYEQIMHTLTKHPAEHNGEGSLRASTRNLTDEEGTTVARSILSMYTYLTEGI